MAESPLNVDVQAKSAAFVVALCNKDATQQEIFWAGITAIFANLTATGDINGAQVALDRLRKLSV